MLLALLVALSVPGFALQEPPEDGPLRAWITAVAAHRPGEVDQPLRIVAAMPATSLRVVFTQLEKELRQRFPGGQLEARNDLRRRAAVVHTDVALLLPEEAAALRFRDIDLRLGPALSGKARPQTTLDALTYSVDGRYLASEIESGHLPFASWLLGGVTDAASDEFVRSWYRAVAATFLDASLYGNAAYHMARGKKLLPRDPVLLFYTGVVHEGLASPRVQAVSAAMPNRIEFMNGHMLSTPQVAVAPEREQLKEAERHLRESLKRGGPAEARLRLGRITGHLGRHADAVALLEGFTPPATDARLIYFRHLFLGTEYAALGRTDAAQVSFEHAAVFWPGAQAPLMALSDLFRRSGNRAAALGVLRELEALPEKRVDPWWDYYWSCAADADAQLKAVRMSVDREPRR